MRRSDHPNRPSAITCCRLSALKTLDIPAASTKPTAPVNVSTPGAALAGFQVSIIGRFWVSTEVLIARGTPERANDGQRLSGRRPPPANRTALVAPGRSNRRLGGGVSWLEQLACNSCRDADCDRDGYCSERVRFTARRCRHCGEALTPVEIKRGEPAPEDARMPDEKGR